MKNTIRKLIPLLLLTVGPCAVHGQSIVISGGQRSIVISGKRQTPEPIAVTVDGGNTVEYVVPTDRPGRFGFSAKMPPESVHQPQKGSDPTSSTSPAAADLSQHAEQPAAGEVSRTTVSERYLISEDWCPNCPAAKAQFLRSGGKPENVITIEQAHQLGYRNPKWSGGIPHQFTLQTVVETHAPQLTSQPHRVQSRNVADQPQNYTEAQRQNDIDHLLTHRSHAGKFTREYLESLSGYQLIDLHNNDHGVPTLKGVKTQAKQVAGVDPLPPMPARYVMYGEQQIDLETYGGCSSKRCGMCRTLRAQQAEYRRLKAIYDQAMQYQQTSIEIPDHQQPTPDDVLRQVIDLLNLSPSDKLADLGCGDGRVLIAAVDRYGCSGVGVEIDPVKADEARSNVQAAGLTGRIAIITDDALRFWPADHGVTAAVAYLYPDLLEQLKPNLQQVRLVVTPFHQVPGMEMEQVGDLFVRREPVRLISRGTVCPNGRCPR